MVDGEKRGLTTAHTEKRKSQEVGVEDTEPPSPPPLPLPPPIFSSLPSPSVCSVCSVCSVVNLFFLPAIHFRA